MNKSFFGWTGKFLRIDLSRKSYAVDDTLSYAKTYIGGRGIAAKIAWDEIPRGVIAFSEENPLILFPGPLTGTSAPYSGRTTVCTLAPQGYPHEWYTRSSFGGHWGPELKYAGWDGLVITGRADKPLYLMIANDQVDFLDAGLLWGKGIFDTQKTIMAQHGKSTRVLAIGPTGEKLCRISIIATETESASGQGGFGAVMGFKNLKAIAVLGSGAVQIADPERFYTICTMVREEAHGSHGWPHPIKLKPEMVEKYGEKFQACTQQCHTGCYDARYYTRVPGRICKNKTFSGQLDCIAGLFPGAEGTFYNWKLGFEAGFELAQMANDLGLNHWELLVGMMPWLRECRRTGQITRFNGREIDLDDPYFWAEVFTAIANRTGMGDVLAEGTVRAAEILGIGTEHLAPLFPAWGYAGHWDGHGDHINMIFFPYWIVAALQWAFDTRDPISSGHGYTQNIMNWSKVRSPEHGLTWEQIMSVGEKVYGTRLAVDPSSSYEAKAIPAVWHGHRSVIKDSITIDDQMFPRIYSAFTADHRARSGDMLGLDFEYYLLTSCTGLSISKPELEVFGERVINLERQLLIRNFDRCRIEDESVIPYFKLEEHNINPLIGKPMALDRQKFLQLMDEYYELRCWDRNTGAPQQGKLQQLGLAFTVSTK